LKNSFVVGYRTFDEKEPIHNQSVDSVESSTYREEFKEKIEKQHFQYNFNPTGKVSLLQRRVPTAEAPTTGIIRNKISNWPMIYDQGREQMKTATVSTRDYMKTRNQALQYKNSNSASHLL
jgi:hypothetical protein